MTVTDFKRGSRTVATLVEVGRLGHAWSGGAAKQPFSDAHGPDASRLAWAFAARQFRLRSPA
jgi:poly(3-hydroxybutyrate) depolymerase